MFNEAATAIRLPILLYMRVSSDKQRDQHTIEGQRDALTDFCSRHGVVPAQVYVDDGINGDLPWSERPGASSLLADVNTRHGGTVLVYLYDRFSRSVYEGLTAARELKAAGATPFSISEPFDICTPIGEYMFIQSLNNAQLWKAQFLEKTKNGSRRKARYGNWMGGSPPLGYRTVGRPGNRRIEPDESYVIPSIEQTPADLARWIFAEIADRGGTLASIAEHLNALGVPSPWSLQQRNGGGKLWRACTVHGIVRSTTYMGTWRYAKKGNQEVVEGECPALVTPEIWTRVQRQLAKNKKGAGRNTRRRYLLRGKIRCGACGGMYCGRTSKPALADKTDGRRGMAYYCIRSYQRRGNGYTPCHSPGVPGWMEHMAWDQIAAFLADPERVTELVANLLRDRTECRDGDQQVSDAAELERLDRAIAAKDGERDAMLTLFRTARIAQAALDRQLDTVDAEENVLRERAGKLRAGLAQTLRLHTAAADAAAMIRRISDTVGDPASLSWEKRRALIDLLVEEITVDTDDSVGKGKRMCGGRSRAVVTVRYRFSDVPGNPPASEPAIPIIYDTVHRIEDNRYRSQPPNPHA